MFSRQFDAAIAELRNAIEIDPAFWFTHTFLGEAYVRKGAYPEAIAEMQRALELEKDNAEIRCNLAYAYAVSGNKTEARKILEYVKAPGNGYVAPYNIAIVYAGLGDKEQAIAWLQKAFQQHSYYIGVVLTTDARLDPLRSDPRFAKIIKKVGFPIEEDRSLKRLGTQLTAPKGD